MKGTQIYLAGPITGCSYHGSVEWRQKVQHLIQQHCWKHNTEEILCYCPMRGYEHLSEVKSIACTDGLPRHVMARDYNDLVTSDAVLMYLPPADKVSKGTVMEMAWCYQNRIPLVCVTPIDGEYATHPMCADAIDFREDTLEAGVKRIISILLP